MDEMFFLYYEELDWSERIRKAGYEVYVDPNALVFHKESVSVGKVSTLKTHYLNRNRILFMRRNKNLLQITLFYIFLAFATVPKNTIVFILKGQWDHLKAFYRAIYWNLTNPKKSAQCHKLEQFSTVTQS
jgi:GT2 family glycosyltransferase